ncbi:MAG: short-chain dehydrogenase/reductase [Acidimicrobiales bacterium]|nr:short-chain dehydrogenase/reductase [Acidimicrobiales bacterium]
MGTGALSGTVALITGAGSGLGAAFARRLAADGARIVVNDLVTEAAELTAKEVEGTTAVFDVCDSAAFDAAIDDTVQRFGSIDIVINNAGIAPAVDEGSQQRFDTAIANAMLRMEGRIGEMQPLGAITSLSDADWDRMIRVHLYGTFYGVRAALRHMQVQRSGVIVNVSSILGQMPSGGPVHYSTAKAAIIALTKNAAAETSHLGIRINAVCPGYIDTPLLEPITDTMRALVVNQLGMGRMGTAAELAELVRFLAGPESSYATGDVFTMSGGYTG